MHFFRVFVVAAVLFNCLGLARAADDKTTLATKARDILKTHCYRCHGQDGTVEGGLNYVLDFKTLVSRKKVVAGDAAKSRLFKRMTSEKSPMPPEEEKARPSAAELGLVKQWIDAGAADFEVASQRPLLAEADVQQAIHADLLRLDARARRYARYFTIAHLYSAGLSEDELQTYRHGLSKLVNSLSWEPDIVVPVAVDPARTLFRIDLRNYKWDSATWTRLIGQYPYGILTGTAAGRAIAVMTDCELPYLRADWFVFAASRPPLYHVLLQLPTTDKELERQLRIDVAQNIQEERVARAGFNSSGVSRNNRLIERHKSGYGAYWKSYDFASNVGRQNLFANPLGPPPGNDSFRHDGGEIIFNLPNGLQAYLLTDHLGKRIDEGPTKIVSVKNKPDPTVINGISCMTCHSRGMIDKSDQVRAHIAQNPTAFSAETVRTINALYPPEAEFKALLQKDAERFTKAVGLTGGTVGATEPVAALADRFTAEVDLPTAAAEVGVRPQALAASLDREPLLAQRLGSLKIEGGTVQRQVFAELFGELIETLRLGQSLARINRTIDEATVVIRQAPNKPVAYIKRGDAFFDKGELDRAVADYTEAVKLDPKNAGAFHNRGLTYASRKDFALAIADYDQAVRLDPDFAEAYHNRALAQAQTGALDKAIADLTKVIRLEPNNLAAQSDRGALYFRKTAYTEALADLNRVLEKQPKSLTTLLRRAEVNQARNAHAEAVADFTAALAIDPQQPSVRQRRAASYHSLKDFEKAISDLREVVRLEPRFAQGHNDLAWLLAACPEAKFRDGKKAVESATRACELTEFKEVEFLDTLAAAHAERGQFEEAIRWQQKAIMLAKEPTVKADFGKRLQSYQSGKAYREP